MPENPGYADLCRSCPPAVRRSRPIREYVALTMPSARAQTIEGFGRERGYYQLVLCANVLSAIPSARARANALRAIKHSLARDGVCLFTTQYRNSYFREMASRRLAQPYLDGFVVRGRRGYSYYGLIDKDQLVRLVERYEFSVRASWARDGSAFVEARPSV